MSMMSEFKSFAMRGNVVDMAVGIVIGGAFGKIVSSFVADVLMPPIGLMLGNVDFSDLAVTLRAAEEGVEAVMLRSGPGGGRPAFPEAEPADAGRCHHRGSGLHLHRRAGGDRAGRAPGEVTR